MPTSTLSFAQLTVDCQDAKQLATFWSALLDQPITGDANQYFAMLAADPGRGLPAMLFLAVPEPRSGKNRWHVDLMSSDRHAHVDRAVALGAERRGDFEEYGTAWTTLADPEGNLFDIGLPH